MKKYYSDLVSCEEGEAEGLCVLSTDGTVRLYMNDDFGASPSSFKQEELLNTRLFTEITEEEAMLRFPRAHL